MPGALHADAPVEDGVEVVVEVALADDEVARLDRGLPRGASDRDEDASGGEREQIHPVQRGHSIDDAQFDGHSSTVTVRWSRLAVAPRSSRRPRSVATTAPR